MNFEARETIVEPARKVPVIAQADVCVLGGSCTGVFAAVRAARLGASVAIVEKQNSFGGTATHGLVNVWHSINDTENKRRIVGGLSLETMERLQRRAAVALTPDNPSRWYTFNSAELILELDRLVVENKIRPFLHTFYCAPVVEDNNLLTAAVVENKNGRGAIRARIFIDATGDGDLAAHLGLPFHIDPQLQPPTVCGILRNFQAQGFDFKELYRRHREEFDLPPDSGWSGPIPGLPQTSLFAETHVFKANCADAEQLTAAEIEGRRQLRACMDMMRKYGPQDRQLALETVASTIGIRETRRFEAEYRLTETDVLSGREFADTVARGSYRVDVHNPKGGGFIFKYLDGAMFTQTAQGIEWGRWRQPAARNPTFYNIPYRIMVSRRAPNLIMAGRMVAADKGAFGAIRVMINLNQLGEAAGVAAVIACQNRQPTKDIDPGELHKTMAAGGSLP